MVLHELKRKGSFVFLPPHQPYLLKAGFQRDTTDITSREDWVPKNETVLGLTLQS